MRNNSWNSVLLRDVATFASGKTPSRSRQADYFDAGTLPWVKTMDLTNAGVLRTDERVTERAISETRLAVLPIGTVLVAMYGGFKQIGRSGVLRVPAATNQAITAILPNPERLNSDYLLYLLNYNIGYWRTVASSSRKDPNITKADVKALPLALPPLREQTVMARVLNDADDLIATLERTITKKQAIKQGMMQQLLTGKTRLPGFTEPWSKGTFDQLAVPSKERAMPSNVPPTTPLVELEQIEGGTGRLIGKSHASDAISLKAVFRPGDVLFGKLRAYLRKFWYADVAGLCTTEVWVLRARAGVDGRFVRFVIETDRFIEAASGAHGTHMPRSDWGTVRNFPVGIPPHGEQMAISSALVDVNTEIELLHVRLAKAWSVKQGLMQQVLTGRTRLPAEEGVT